MAQQLNPDLLYQKTREDLLLYEDSRLTALLNGTANFYVTKNDQLLWGSFLRAVAKELARLEYDYAYDLVAKDPQFLTPSDIKRRWSSPLFISGNYPSSDQSDLDYRTMLVKLLTAYRQGATPQAISDVVFAYTGLRIVVQELYKQIGNGVYDQSDRNSIRIAVNVGGTNPLLDVTALNQLQLIVNSLYTAIDLAKPAHVGLEFTTVFGSDEDISAFDEDISESPQEGIKDKFTITLRLVENPPFNPMLYQAPILDPKNPTTTVAPYGRQFAGPLLTLTSSQWAALPSISFSITNALANGTQAVYTFSGSSQALHKGLQVTITGCSNPALNITAQISSTKGNTFTLPLQQVIAPATQTGVGLITPTLQAAYTANGSNYVVGMANWSALTAFFKGQIIMDINGNTQMAVVGGVSGSYSTTPFVPAWSTVLNGQVTDGSVVWRTVGIGLAYTPSYQWIMLLTAGVPSITSPLPPTGEIGNWDSTHPIGLLAPRLNLAWEIGGDSLQTFELN